MATTDPDMLRYTLFCQFLRARGWLRAEVDIDLAAKSFLQYLDEVFHAPGQPPGQELSTVEAGAKAADLLYPQS